MTRNAVCIGHPHSTRLGCGWKGERFPSVQMTREVPFTLLPGSRLVFTEGYIAAVAKKPCPQCGGIVQPIVTEDIGWPPQGSDGPAHRASTEVAP